MLDFYIIDDETDTPSYPEKNELEWAGSLNLKQFEDIQKKQLLPDMLEYYSNFRLKQEITLERYENILLRYPTLRKDKFNVESIVKLYGILRLAVESNQGLITYGD